MILYNLGIKMGLRFLTSIYDGSVNIVYASAEDDQNARAILEKYSDQDMSLADAVALGTMKRLGIIKALSFDRHFGVLGFLRIPPLQNLTL